MTFIVCIKTEDIYSEIARDVATRFDASNYELHCLKEEKVIGLIKYELCGKMKEFAALRVKTYNNHEDKKAKDTKKCVVKRSFKFEDYKHCLEATQLENKTNHLEKHNINVNNL